MKKILAALLIMLPVIGFAEPDEKKETKPLMMNMETICNDSSLLDLVMFKYGEMPVIKMESIRSVAKGVDNTSFVSVLFVNERTRSWTLIEERGPLYCVIGVGINIQIVSDKKSEEQTKYY